jgi:hypothetical protein
VCLYVAQQRVSALLGNDLLEPGASWVKRATGEMYPANMLREYWAYFSAHPFRHYQRCVFHAWNASGKISRAAAQLNPSWATAWGPRRFFGARPSPLPYPPARTRGSGDGLARNGARRVRFFGEGPSCLRLSPAVTAQCSMKHEARKNSRPLRGDGQGTDKGVWQPRTVYPMGVCPRPRDICAKMMGASVYKRRFCCPFQRHRCWRRQEPRLKF